MENKYIKEFDDALPVLNALGYKTNKDKNILIKDGIEYKLSLMENNYGYNIPEDYLRFDSGSTIVYLEFVKYGDSLKFNKIRINELEYNKDKSKKFENKAFTFGLVNKDEIKIVDKKQRYEATFGHDYISLFDYDLEYSLGFFYSNIVNPKYSNIDSNIEKDGFIRLFNRLCVDHEDLMGYIMGEIEEVVFNYSFVNQMQFDEKEKSK